MDKDSIVVNIFGGPGMGKSTIAAGIFYSLKRMQVSCEFATEYAKDLVWDKHTSMLQNPVMVFANQHHRIERLRKQVDVIITDSPFIMGIPYATSNYKLLSPLMMEAWHTFHNINIMLKRSTTYDTKGRIHTEDQAIEKDQEIQKLLDDNNLSYYTINPNEFHNTSEHIVDTIIRPKLRD